MMPPRRRPGRIRALGECVCVYTSQEIMFISVFFVCFRFRSVNFSSMCYTLHRQLIPADFHTRALGATFRDHIEWLTMDFSTQSEIKSPPVGVMITVVRSLVRTPKGFPSMYIVDSSTRSDLPFAV